MAEMRQMHLPGEDPEDDSTRSSAAAETQRPSPPAEQQPATGIKTETPTDTAGPASRRPSRFLLGEAAGGQGGGGEAAVAAKGEAEGGGRGARLGDLLHRIKREPCETSSGSSASGAVESLHVGVKQVSGEDAHSVSAASNEQKRKRVYGPTPRPSPTSAGEQLGAHQGEDASFGIRKDLLPPPAIQERARKLQEQREAREQAVVAARNAAIDQAVREQRERQQQQQQQTRTQTQPQTQTPTQQRTQTQQQTQTQEGTTSNSGNRLEDEKLRFLKEEGQRHEEEKARRRKLLEAKEKFQEQLEEQWRVKHEGSGLLKMMQQQAFLAEGASVEDFINRRRARRLKALGEEHELLATRAEQRF